MAPSPAYTFSGGPEPVEFSFEDALLNTWVEDGSVYLKLDEEPTQHEVPQPDQS
jgi:hypothetical protein